MAIKAVHRQQIDSKRVGSSAAEVKGKELRALAPTPSTKGLKNQEVHHYTNENGEDRPTSLFICPFRWAACQIDILGRLHTVSEIHEALNELPETLDETYERILMKIPVKKRMVAHKILQLLAFDDIGIYGDPDLVAEAVIVDVEQLTFKPEYRFLDQDALFEICTCLITLDGYHKVNIAHYSVKEYLVSNRIQHSTAAAFQISPAAYHVLLAKTALVYLLDITYDGLCSAKDYDEQDDADERDYKIHEKDNFPYLAEAHSWVDKVNAAKSGLIEVHDEAIINGLVAGLLNSNRAIYAQSSHTGKESRGKVIYWWAQSTD
ncbi:hypothetical protein MMC31_006354 [Peltigera leucophlebia]|nr:hypothetical protein [Peltigera leucophlebia]